MLTKRQVLVLLLVLLVLDLESGLVLACDLVLLVLDLGPRAILQSLRILNCTIPQMSMRAPRPGQ